MWPRIHNASPLPHYPLLGPFLFPFPLHPSLWPVKQLARVSHSSGYLLGHTSRFPPGITLTSRSVGPASTRTHSHTHTHIFTWSHECLAYKLAQADMRKSLLAAHYLVRPSGCSGLASLSRSRWRKASSDLIFSLWVYLTFRILKVFF